MNRKIKTIILIIIILLVITAVSFIFDFSKEDVKYGVTFSQIYADYELGLDWQEVYLAILDDLKVDNIRLSAYWNQIESKKDVYYFKDLDWQIKEASKRGVSIILGIGRRLPRWPECHDPDWIADMSEKEIRAEQLKLVEAVITRYDNNDNIKMWQIENEPFLEAFGECPPLDRLALEQEIELAKELSEKPILVTDSGELNLWLRAADTGADVVGSTLYRVVYNEKIGYFRYPIPPLFYYTKAFIIKKLFKTKSVINSELQTEAWHTRKADLTEMSLEEQFESMDLKQFRKNVTFARKSGFSEIYLWGAEWWYFLKTEREYQYLWEEAKRLWQ